MTIKRFLKAALITGSVVFSASNYAEITDNTINIGIITDATGGWSDSTGQGALIASQMAVNDVGGSVNGAPVNLVMIDYTTEIKKYKDNTGNKVMTMDDYTKMVRQIVSNLESQYNIDAISELSDSRIAIPAQNYAREKGIVSLVVGAGSTALTNQFCSKTGFHWSWDTYALTKGLGKVIVENENSDKWYFLALEGAFGEDAINKSRAVIKTNGGKIVGKQMFPYGYGATNFFPAIEEARQRGANVIAIANAGDEAIAAIRQVRESGIFEKEGTVVSLITLLQDIRKLGLYSSRNLQFVAPFYWNRDEKTRNFAKRFLARHGAVPSAAQAAMYSATLHYLRGVAESDYDKGETLANKMRALNVDPRDPFLDPKTSFRKDGRVVHDMYLVEVKSPQETTEAWDYFKLIRTIPGSEAYQPLSETKCKFAK
ncbi:MAG: hypothetical protein D6B28_02735 [Gammaproteobacteria bacterium]|nr:MAG: hypothetical protein D6B28_02735 [Gammaproteobacteria bacterium]